MPFETQLPERPAEAVRARHAQIVPSFVLALLQRPMDCRLGAVQVSELVCWERFADLTESVRSELRESVIRRLRTSADRLWACRVGVHLVESWRQALPPGHRKRFEGLLAATGERPLEELTLREVKEALKLPLEQTFTILAKLEALYWEPPASPAPGATPGTTRAAGCTVTPEMRSLAEEVLLLPWLKDVKPTDVRFAYSGEASLPDWVRSQMTRTTVQQRVPDLLNNLLAADRLTAAEEARAVTEAVELLTRRSHPEASRWAAIVLRRHISPLGSGRTLLEVGNEYGVTRERIRQICEPFEAAFTQVAIAVPALDRVLAETSRMAPASIDEVNQQLAHLIGEGAGIEALLHWASVLGRDVVSVSCRHTRARVRGQLVDIKVIDRTQTAPWLAALVRHVGRDCSMFGCTNILRVAGLLALRHGAAPGQEAIEKALEEGAAGFRWLDRESGWFALGDGSACSAASRVRKMMAVAHDHLGANEIAAALAADDLWMYRETQSLGLATPPVHVLRELLLGWSWLRVIQKGRFAPADDFDATGALTEPEALAVKVIAEHAGVACLFEIKGAVMEKLKVTEVMISSMLGSSPIFDRVEHGLYRLVGRRVGDDAVKAARLRLRARGSHASVVVDGAGPNVFGATITEAALRQEQYHVPERFKRRLCRQLLVVHDVDGVAIGNAHVNKSGALRGLNRLFPDARAGDRYRVEVLDEGLQVSLLPGAPPGAPPALADSASDGN